MYLKGIIVLQALFICSLSSTSGAGESLRFSSGEQQVQLVELYTSQGCSSCPPAENWLNQLKSDERLWNNIVPIAFHVDYWDYLGWRDIYASNRFSNRQRRHRNAGNVASVYTPGFVLNGKEWKGWFSRDPLPKAVAQRGILAASLQQNRLMASYSRTPDSELVLNVAVLGFEIDTPIAAGENAGRKLRHEFVVLAHDNHVSDSGQWQVDLPAVKADLASRFALALWVSPAGKQQPLQATGGWLPRDIF